jgi:thioredoxin 1
MKNLAAALLLLAATVAASDADAPYNEAANANSDVHQALDLARANHRQTLLVFGANWCPDCRALDKALRGNSRALIEDHFTVVKVDVGNFDRNLDLAQRYGNPIKNGIPAVVVLDAGGLVAYSTKAGELANARKMGDRGIYDFLEHNLVTPGR